VFFNELAHTFTSLPHGFSSVLSALAFPLGTFAHLPTTLPTTPTTTCQLGVCTPPYYPPKEVGRLAGWLPAADLLLKNKRAK
jgi:hypothetical protein